MDGAELKHCMQLTLGLGNRECIYDKNVAKKMQIQRFIRRFSRKAEKVLVRSSPRVYIVYFLSFVIFSLVSFKDQIRNSMYM